MNDFKVKKIDYESTKEWILKKHYAQRMPSISYAYGLFKNDIFVGVLTIGKPVSNGLCTNLCGEKFKQKVYELNRLVTEEGLPENHLSWFISQVLKSLANEKLILVSYADEGMNHHGYIYQATNWLYTGKTKKRTDKYTENGKHSRHYIDDDSTSHLRKIRDSKYRYVYFTDRKMRKNPELYLNTKKYPIIKQYPKGDNEKYILGESKKDIIINTLKGSELKL